MNTTNNQSRFTSQELADSIKRHIEELATATDVSRVSSGMLSYLESCSRFHQYSFHNILLIMMACPHAAQVAGFHAWYKLNRFVRKGEHGIPILAPVLVKEKTEDKEGKSFLCGFKVVYVFDISQTDGEPLPEPPDWKSPEKNALLAERLIIFARERGITVTEKVLAGEIQGVSRGGSIDLSNEAGTSTLIHELGHELLHKQEERLTMSREEKELEAESVAWVVSKHFGLQGSGSPNYLALFGVSSELIVKHLERISKTSAEIILELEKERTLTV